MQSLNSIKPGKKVQIVEIRSGKGLVNRLSSMGLYPGSKVQIISNPANGPLILAKNSSRLGLGFGVANKIFVKSVLEEEKESAPHSD
ncbi:ferrous iron transport protein A [candidate division KSB1 bacterium]